MGLTKPRAAQIYNLDYKQATRVVAVTNITLSGGAPATVDGVSLSLNDRVLVTGQGTASQNGLYLVTTVGSGANGTWTRTTDANQTGEIDAGMIVMVTEGAIYADTQWKLITDNPITVGSTALTFTQNYSANSITGGTSNVTVYSNANVTISSAGTANVLTISSTGTVVKGTESVTGNITAGGYITNSTYISTNTLSAVGAVITGNITGGNISATTHTGTTVSVSGTVYTASTVGGVITGSSASVTGAVTAASTVGGVITGSSASVTGTQTAASTVGGVITGSSLSVTTGTITGGNIVNGNGNGVGNIGSSTTYFNTVFAKATSAQYADLAEMYCADSKYAPGTVVEFSGTAEITATTESHSTRVAGIISTNPSYLMNSTLDCKNSLEVALVGRVPCSVVGTVRKGDRLVASGLFPGVAQALDMSLYQPGCIIGKSLEDYNSAEPGVIEVAVGRA
jgi:hypothetical protein